MNEQEAIDLIERGLQELGCALLGIPEHKTRVVFKSSERMGSRIKHVVTLARGEQTVTVSFSEDAPGVQS